MAEVSAAVGDMSRKIERTILQALAEQGQATAAVLMGVSESAVSRMKDGQLEALSKLLAATGLKVVPAKYKCMDPVKAQAMVTLYEAAMQRIPNTVELLFGDEA
jgi:predicted XRE-type DNA-binding protein